MTTADVLDVDAVAVVGHDSPGEVLDMAERTQLWRRVHVALEARGETMAELLERLPWTGTRAYKATRLNWTLAGARADGRIYTERKGARGEIEDALDLPRGALDDGAEWTLEVKGRDGAGWPIRL